MAYDEQLAARVRPIAERRPGFDEKHMFGGVGFLWNGNMCCGVYKEFLICRLGDEAGAEALQDAHTKPFDITGRVMKGWIMVGPGGTKSDKDLNAWVARSISFAGSLPPK